ncbi:hypothetical protein BH10ACI3_BH10ACI3_20790 [soil metagenome]
MNESTLIELEKLFLSLSDKTRLRLLGLMANGEVSVGYLADTLGESQPKISRHLAYLRTAGLVSTRRDGKWIYYGIETGLSEPVTTVLDAIFDRPVIAGSKMSAAYDRSGEGDTCSENDDEDELAETSSDVWTPAELDIWLL